jgi:GT2 family glycosyltransferase
VISTPVANDGAWTLAVAIPVKNEADRIAACLTALSDQRGLGADVQVPFDVVLFVNNSDDGTAEIATALAATLQFRLTVVTATLPPEDASAGGARRHAMEAAAQLLEHRGGAGLLLTTDADSRVPPDWVAKTLAAIEAGADAVAGTIALDPDDEAALPAKLKARGALEAAYETLVCELEARLDPQPHDPWPRHPTESGASFALTLASFRAVGGVPDRALGEDRALASALRVGGFRVRHAPEVQVITSGRLVGRAEGGCADTMRHRIEEPNARCDEYLRPALDVLRQAKTRAPGTPYGIGSRTIGPEELPMQIMIARTLLMGLKIRSALLGRINQGQSVLAGLTAQGKLLDPTVALSSETDAEVASSP